MRATPTSAPFGALFLTQGQNGAGERNRTPDRLITNQLLYLLSYASEAWGTEQQTAPADGVRIIPSGGLIVKRLGQPKSQAFHDQIGAVCGRQAKILQRDRTATGE